LHPRSLGLNNPGKATVGDSRKVIIDWRIKRSERFCHVISKLQERVPKKLDRGGGGVAV